MTKLVLGIETSCDDTSMAIIREGDSPEILAHLSFDQEKALQKWGGVVPEIAARNHLEKIPLLLEQVLKDAKLDITDIDMIGVTTHPGLLGPLLTGLNCAKSLSLIHQIPITPVNHLFAHMEAIHIDQNVSYPYLGLLISGGHSLYLWVESGTKFTVLGSTIDDAAGEAFDKGAKLLDLGYPGGHIIDRLSKWGDPTKYDFPIGLQSSADSRLSFSGLKTALRVFLEKSPNILSSKPSQLKSQENASKDFYDVCASYQNSIVKALKLKMKYAIKEASEKYGLKDFPIVIGGGVACNSLIQTEFKSFFKNVHCVTPHFCTDNGAMIANYAMRNQQLAIAYPDCLRMDAKGRFIDKKDYQR